MTRQVRWLPLLQLLVTTPVLAQQPSPPVIDSIAIVSHNVFEDSVAQRNFFFRLTNALRVPTRAAVVRRELLFKEGEPYDSALVAETSRNLRGLGIFRDATIDTFRVEDKLVAKIETGDAWSTQLQLNFNFADTTFTWSTGLVERNFLGTASRVGASYRQEPDRNAFTLLASTERFFNTNLAMLGVYDNLSDGTRGGWGLGIPFRSLSDRRAFNVPGSASNERILQFRDGALAETYQRRHFLQTARIAVAPSAGSSGYVRLGVAGQIRREEYYLQGMDPAAVPDTVTGAVGVFTEVGRARFKVLQYYNGFARSYDLDLSSRALLSGWVAPTAFGYAENGIGIAITGQTGAPFGRNFALLTAHANGLFTASALDSGQVVVRLTVASQIIRKNTTVLHIQAGAQEGLPPGSEFDIGQGFGPRAFGPHAFTGDRMIWGSLEHRWFLVDELIGLFGLGFAAFVDYGGAWYADQPRRLGGNVGGGLRIGATRATGSNVGRLDIAYRFGDGFEEKRWVLSFGRGFPF